MTLPEFTPYETDWNQEFVAGWLDGYRASKVSVLNVARGELLRYDLVVDEDGRVNDGRAEAAGESTGIATPLPDNPHLHDAYEEGWEAGYAEGHQVTVRELRAQLAPRNLFVTDTGSITTMDVASELVDYCRDIAEGESDGITDAAIHAFIDGTSRGGVQARSDVEEEASGGALRAPDASSAAAHAAPSASLLTWLRGVWTMVKREVDRRTALIAMGSVLATASVGWLVMDGNGSDPLQRTQEGTGGVETGSPQGWSGYPAAARNQFTEWDRFAKMMEQSGGVSALQATIQSVMSGSGNDQLKCNMATFVGNSGRTQYVTALLFGLQTTLSSATARRTILANIYRLNRRGMLVPIPKNVGDALVIYKQSGVESDFGAQLVLNKLVDAFKAQ